MIIFPPISATTAVIHSQIMAKETRKSFFLTSPCSVLISQGLACLLSITIAHLFSFVSSLVSPFSPFSFPLRSLYSCFHFNPISQSSATRIFRNPSQSFHKRSDKLFLTSSTCLSSFSSFFQPHMLIFPSTTPFPDFFSLPFSAPTHFHSVKCAVSRSSLAKPSMDQLSSLA